MASLSCLHTLHSLPGFLVLVERFLLKCWYSISVNASQRKLQQQCPNKRQPDRCLSAAFRLFRGHLLGTFPSFLLRPMSCCHLAIPLSSWPCWRWDCCVDVVVTSAGKVARCGIPHSGNWGGGWGQRRICKGNVERIPWCWGEYQPEGHPGALYCAVHDMMCSVAEIASFLFWSQTLHASFFHHGLVTYVVNNTWVLSFCLENWHTWPACRKGVSFLMRVLWKLVTTTALHHCLVRSRFLHSIH